jgi:MFS superfamily sulfate permease-like transporter
MQGNSRQNSGWLARAARVAPGLPALLRYRAADFPHDLVAGLSVAAVALPIGVAYADLAGFSPVVGLYASILPLAGYALFGTSRQLVVGPDAATCAMVAAAVGPMAGGDPVLYQSLSVVLALIAGLLCIAGSFLRLGALADFLSKPILVGFLNGIALVVTIGVVAVGAIDAILLAVAIALVRFVARPMVELLGEVPDLTGFHSLARHSGASATPGLVLLRFNGPIVFFNTGYWKRSVLAAVDAAGPALRWLVIDMIPVTFVDATGIYTAREVFDGLRARGVVVALAGRKTEWANWTRERGFAPLSETHPNFASLDEALAAYRATVTAAAV